MAQEKLYFFYCKKVILYPLASKHEAIKNSLKWSS